MDITHKRLRPPPQRNCQNSLQCAVIVSATVPTACFSKFVTPGAVRGAVYGRSLTQRRHSCMLLKSSRGLKSIPSLHFKTNQSSIAAASPAANHKTFVRPTTLPQLPDAPRKTVVMQAPQTSKPRKRVQLGDETEPATGQCPDLRQQVPKTCSCHSYRMQRSAQNKHCAEMQPADE